MDSRWFANRGQIIQTALAGVACVVAAFKVWPEMAANHFLSLGSFIFYILVSLVIVSITRAVSRRGSSRIEQIGPDLPIALLTEDCEYFLKILRRLLLDRPIEARLPLNNASWPAFGQPWQAIHATLYAFNSHFRAFLVSARAAWKDFGQPDKSVELFRVGDATVIVDLIDSIEKFRDDLKQLAMQA